MERLQAALDKARRARDSQAAGSDPAAAVPPGSAATAAGMAPGGPHPDPAPGAQAGACRRVGSRRRCLRGVTPRSIVASASATVRRPRPD